MKKKLPWKRILVWSVVIAGSGLFAMGLLVLAYLGVINSNIDTRMEQLHSARSSSFYALNPALRPGQHFSRSELRAFLEDQGYRESKDPEDLLAGEFLWERAASVPTLLVDRPEFTGAGRPLDRLGVRIEFEDKEGVLEITEIRKSNGGESIEALESLPKLVGSYLAGRLRTQNVVLLSDIPVSMRLAIMAIEDTKFLEHHGVSLRGTIRAFVKNLSAGWGSQGGSTITQQLMKNLFFSKKKEITRKLKEALYAFVTEVRYSKEQILEAYLNEVYFGQWSTHEIHGVAEAARHFFGMPVSEISIAQSALLAAVVQAPNSLDPRRNPDRAKNRRNLVLKKMLEADFILPPEYQEAINEPLNVVPPERSLDDVEYFLDLVMQKLPSSIASRLDKEVLTLYVTLNPYLQGLAGKSLSTTIDKLTKGNAALLEREKKGSKLQGSLIAIDPQDCTVLAVQGGRNYRQTQFNRVLQGKRQPGSLFKPFVALAAFTTKTAEGPITPTTIFEDEPFEWKYDKQLWKPKNYDGKFRGPVTVRDAIEQSINIPTARIAQRIGVGPMVDTIKKVGITSPIPQVPSLALGSADVSPIELAEAYTTIAGIGKLCTLRPYVEVYDENRNSIHQNPLTKEDRIDPAAAYQTVNVMKGTFTHGTARGVSWSGIDFKNYAGKTGTTNEANDAWFVGFSPRLLVLVWVGYDEKAKVGLTGAAAALPIWLDFIKNAGPFRDTSEFPIPAGLTRCEVERKIVSTVETEKRTERYMEYYQTGTEPASFTCESAPVTPIP